MVSYALCYKFVSFSCLKVECGHLKYWVLGFCPGMTNSLTSKGTVFWWCLSFLKGACLVTLGYGFVGLGWFHFYKLYKKVSLVNLSA